MATENDAAGDAPTANDDARLEHAAPTPAAPMDPDDAALAAAEAAALAEETGQQPDATPAPGPQEGAQDAPAAAVQQPPSPSGDGQQAPPAIPYARFQEVVQRAREAEHRLAMAQGAISVLTKQTGATAPAAPSQAQETAPPPAQNSQATIAAKEAELFAAAEKFDAGEITMAELKRLESRITGEIFAMRGEALLERVPQPQPQAPSITDQMLANRQLEELYAKHPYAAALSEQQAEALAEKAHAEAQAKGQPYGGGLAETMRLREHIAVLSDVYGPVWGIAPQAARPSQQQPAATPPASGAGGMSAAAQARLNKLNLAASHPPETAALGSGGGSDEFSESRIMAMSDDEIAALPASVQERLLARA